ncbi:DUF58 domain-containing protein [Halobacteriales archaeon QH_10_65_19]|nr:MAG: DUF58 domain-containing protein [Halobacteriales archaeon QH_10_65_19]
MRRHVKRWSVGLIATLALLGTGLLYADPVLLAAALIPLTYVLYGTLSRVPGEAELSISRSIDPGTPEPGEGVTVTLTVRNKDEQVLPDVRVIDGVPEELAVTSGSARTGTPLSPDEHEQITYTVVAKRGEFSFEAPAVRVRSLAGSDRVTRSVPAEGDTVVSCTNVRGEAPIQHSTINRQGSLSVDSGGPGQEFFATRQYKRGDPVNRIDWHHVAKTGEFITVQYRREQSARTVLVVDARPLNRVTAAPGYPTGAQLSAYAGERLFEALSGAGVQTSVTALGVDPGDLDGLVGPDGLPWIDPQGEAGRRGRAAFLFHRLQTEASREVSPPSLEFPASVFADGAGDWTGGGISHKRPPGAAGSAVGAQGPGGYTDPYPGARADGGPTGGGWGRRPIGDGEVDKRIRRLLSRLPGSAQVVLCSPLLDNWPVSLGGALSMHEYPLVVVSPDVVNAASPGQRLAAVARRSRLRALDRTGVDTVDWRTDSPIDDAVRLSLPHLLSDQ